MADEVVGSAYVIIRAITNKIRDDIRDGVKRGATQSKSDLEDAGETMGEIIGEEAGEAAGAKTSEGVRKRLRDDRGRFRAAGSQIGDQIGEGIRRGGWLKRVTKSIRDTLARDAGGPNAGQRWGRKIGDAIGRGISGVPLLPFVLTMLVPALGGGLKVIAAYVGAATALLASLGPAIAGSVTAGIGAYTALFQAIGAVTLALKAKSPELEKFNNLMQGIGERFLGIGLKIQSVLLKPLGDAIELITRELLPELEEGLVGTGKVIAGLATDLGQLTTAPIFQRSFAQMLSNNNRFLRQFGGGLLGLVSSLVIVLSAARPVLDVFGKFVRRLGLGADEAAKAGKRTGALADFFDRAAESMKQWGRIIGNVGTALGNIFKIAAPFGQILTNRLERLTKRFRLFTESAEGENKIALFFKNSLPIVREFNGLLGDVVKMMFGGLAKPGGAKGTVEFLQALRRDFLPAIGSMVDSLSGLGPHLIDLSIAFASMIESLSESGGLGAFVTTLGSIFDGISTLLSLPVVGQLAGWAVALLGVGKAFDFVLKPIGGIAKVLKPAFGFIGKFVTKFANSFKLLRAAFALGGAGPVSSFVAALGASLGPILLVIGAIVAMGVAITLLWKKNEKFRNIVKGIWSDIKDAIAGFVSFFTDEVWPALSGIFDLISQSWKDLTGDTSTQLEVLKGILTGVLNFFLERFRITWEVIKGVTQGVWIAIKGIIMGALKVIEGVINTVMGVIKGDWGQAWKGIKQIFSGVWTAIKAILKAQLKILGTLFRAGFDTIKATLKLAWDTIVSLAKFGGDRLVGAIKGIPDKLKNLGRVFLGAGKALIGALLKGLGQAGEFVGGFARDMANAVIDTINGMIDQINGLLKFDFKVKGVGFSVDAPDIGHIPRLATGGRVTDGTLAIIGEGKEAETVLPDSLLRGLIERANETGRAQERRESAGSDNVRPIQVTVHNPIAEKASDSIVRQLVTVAQLGLLERE